MRNRGGRSGEWTARREHTLSPCISPRPQAASAVDPPMPQETKSMPAELLEKQHSVAGWSVDLTDDALSRSTCWRRRSTIGATSRFTLKDGRTIAGYLFDRRARARRSRTHRSASWGVPSDEKITVRYADIKHIAFSDRDPAAGKSFETWVKKYIEKKLAGEKASIESEARWIEHRRDWLEPRRARMEAAGGKPRSPPASQRRPRKARRDHSSGTFVFPTLKGSYRAIINPTRSARRTRSRCTSSRVREPHPRTIVACGVPSGS